MAQALGECPPQTLPVQRGPLFGRDQAVREVVALLREHGGLLTLTGPGGVGKTRLAVQVAADTRAAFADGVCFVALASLRNPDLVGPTIARALGLLERGGQPSLARLTGALRRQHLLLVLDNCEHLLPAAPLVADLLAACPRLTVLATSRAALRLSGEREFLVPPLAVPDLGHMPEPDALAQYAAVALFVARARAVQSDFALTAVNATAVAAICQRLDGLPLALELAAARVRTLPPQALLPRLDQSLVLLTGGARDLPARQQTLRQTLAWSHGLLGAGEQLLFARLAVFVGGGTLDAIEAVCGAAGEGIAPLPLTVLDGLDALVGHNLVRQETGPDGEPRFLMLVTIHEFARECLAREPSGQSEEAALRQWHAAYYLEVAEGIALRLYGRDHGDLLDRLERDTGNLHAALDWLVGHGDAACAVRLASALRRFWEVRGYVVEGYAHSAAVLALARRAETLPPAALAQALNVAGYLASWREDMTAVHALHEEELALRRAIGDDRGTASALLALASTEQSLGNHAAAHAHYVEMLAVARRCGEHHLVALATINLGHVAYNQGDFATARTRYEESLPLFERLDDQQRVARTIEFLGHIAHREGDHAAAQRLLERGLAGFREVRYWSGIADTLCKLGYLALDRGDLSAASAYIGEALTFARAMDYQNLAQLLDEIARLALAVGEPTVAFRLLSAATQLRERTGAILPVPESLDHERALAAARHALGAPEAERAWAAGRVTALDEILAEARRVAELAPGPAAEGQTSRPHRAPSPFALTAREVEVLHLVAEGLTNAQVAARLFVTPRTVNAHLTSIYTKLGVENRAAAIRRALDLGLA